MQSFGLATVLLSLAAWFALNAWHDVGSQRIMDDRVVCGLSGSVPEPCLRQASASIEGVYGPRRLTASLVLVADGIGEEHQAWFARRAGFRPSEGLRVVVLLRDDELVGLISDDVLWWSRSAGFQGAAAWGFWAIFLGFLGWGLLARRTGVARAGLPAGAAGCAVLVLGVPWSWALWVFALGFVISGRHRIAAPVRRRLGLPQRGTHARRW